MGLIESIMGTDVGAANNSLASNIFTLLNAEDSNVLFSPWSMFNALAMTYVGARGNTAAQMATGLCLKNNPEDERTFDAVAKTLESLESLGPVEYATANKIWVHSGFELLSDFKRIVKNYFASEGALVDYVNDREGARKEINSWVEEQTNSKIKELITPGLLNQYTRLVLTSAVYFKGKWMHEFRPQSTQTKSFKTSKGKAVNVQMMYMKAKKDMRYYETEQFQVLALPYKGRRLTLNIILPKDGDGLGSVLKSVLKDSSQLQKCICPEVLFQPIEIMIPRFKFDFDKNYNDILVKLGFQDMFSDAVADFSGISTVKPGLKVSAVVQKAFIEVNEEGTEAAAATAAIMMQRCAMPVQRPLIFNADHPFLFFISDVETKVILFMGKVVDPS